MNSKDKGMKKAVFLLRLVHFLSFLGIVAKYVLLLWPFLRLGNALVGYLRATREKEGAQ